MAAKLYELGDAAGQGAAFKMINQLLAGVHIAAASEAITFAAKQGLDIRKVYEVITASAGNSWMFENRVPHVLDGDYAPRSAVDIFVKDLGIIQDMARTAKFPVPVSAAALQMFLMTSALRHGPRRRRLGGEDVREGDGNQAAGRLDLIKNRGHSMPHFAANLSMMFNEVPFLDRFEAAAKAGFTAVEFLFPYDYPAEEVGERLKRNGLTQALFNLPPGNWDAGEKGFAALPDRFSEFAAEPAHRAALCESHAGEAGASDGGDHRAQRSAGSGGVSQIGYVGDGVFCTARNRCRHRADQSAQRAWLFPQRFFLRTRSHPRAENPEPETAVRHLSLPDHPRRRDDASARDDADIGHIQIASIPSRNEPDGEELNYPFLFDELDRLGYKGFVGCEYNPRGKTEDGLGWFKQYAGAKA